MIIVNIISTVKHCSKMGYIKLLQKFELGDYVHYIGGGTYLPPPLSPEEELEYISKISEEKSRQILIEHNLRLVVYIAKKIENKQKISRKMKK